jgi:type IV secretion system protein TrbL
VRVAKGVGIVVVIFIALAAVAAVGQAQTAAGGGLLDQVTQSYRLAAHGWFGRMIPIAQRTFALLAAVEVSISGLWYGMRREALDEVAARFVLKFALLAVLLAAISSSGVWLPAIVNAFAFAGEQAVGQGGVAGPSEIVDLGAAIAGQMTVAMDNWGILHHPSMALYGALCAIIVLGSYVFVAGQLMVTVIESYVILGGGVVLLGLAAWRGSAGYAEAFVNRVVHIGVKIFLLYLVVGIGIDVSRSWLPLLTPDNAFGAGSPVWQVIGGAVTFAILSERIPNTNASAIVAHPTFGIAHALRTL